MESGKYFLIIDRQLCHRVCGQTMINNRDGTVNDANSVPLLAPSETRQKC